MMKKGGSTLVSKTAVFLYVVAFVAGLVLWRLRGDSGPREPFGMAKSLVMLKESKFVASVTVAPFGDAADAVLYTLKYGNLEVRATNIGAVITHFLVTDPLSGVAKDVVMGFDEPLPYQNGTSPAFGAIVGRVANRIAGGSFELDGTVYTLEKNDGNNTLHGGFTGFGRRLWQHEIVKTDKGASVRFMYHSPDGEEGFPGTLDVAVTYTILLGEQFTVEMTGSTSDKATPLNLAQHTYWNLAGHDSGEVLWHNLHVNADKYTPSNKELIPTGEILPVSGTPMDFHKDNWIGANIASVGGYDHNYVISDSPDESPDRVTLWPGLLEGVTGVRHAVSVLEPGERLSMRLYTNAPAVQLYTANGVNDLAGKGGAVYKKYGAYCFETQGFPNAINQPNFPSVVIRPGETYTHVMLFRFLFH